MKKKRKRSPLTQRPNRPAPRRVPFTNRKSPCWLYFPTIAPVRAKLRMLIRTTLGAPTPQEERRIENLREEYKSLRETLHAEHQILRVQRAGHLERIRGAMNACDYSRATSIYHELAALPGVSDDTLRKAAKAASPF